MSQSILVVDDDQSILSTIQDILSAEGFPVRTARNGAEGLESVRNDPPDLVLLDLWMPKMGGQEMARQMREANIRVPILVMSAIQTGDKIARQMDAAGFIPKPFDLNQLLGEIERLLNEHPPPESAGGLL